jgi:hypothetical protein
MERYRDDTEKAAADRSDTGQGCGVGAAILLLGLVLSVCLLPYLISSVYSVASAVFQTPAPANWLWGDWLSTVIAVDSPLYMVLAEGPMCCAGALGLLIIVLGAVLMAGGNKEGQEYEETS